MRVRGLKAVLFAFSMLIWVSMGEFADRTSELDATDLICQIGHPQLTGERIKSFSIPYYYALGTKGDMDNTEMFRLQQAIFNSVTRNVAWCYSEVETSSVDNSTRSLNFRRNLLPKLSDMARQLGVLSVAAGPTDEDVGECPDTLALQDKIAQYESSACRTIHGNIRVIAHSQNNLDYMTAAMQDALEDSMNMYELWKEWTVSLPDLAFLYYAGDTYDEVYLRPNPHDDDAYLNFNSTNSTRNETAGGARGVFGDNTAGALVLLLGVGLPVAAALILFALVVQKRRRAMMTAGDYGMMTSEFVLVGTGDPPGSFHEGLYHYMPEGTRYLSTNCEGCIETRRNSFYTDNNLGPIPEDREYEEDILISLNSKDLGGRAATMDVHRCKSSTCNRCNSCVETKRTFFVPSLRMHHSQEVFHAIPEHAEV